MLKRVFRLLPVCAICLVLVVEVSARLFLQLPRYLADREVGYALRPNQSGTFAGNHWIFNDKGMGVRANFEPREGQDVLLVGDSLVFGGTELDQTERLGALLFGNTSARVWPLAAGSWSLLNELRAIERASAIRPGVEVVIFIVNSGDFGSPSAWNNNNTHPTSFPYYYSGYLANRYYFKSDDGLKDGTIQLSNFERAWIEFVEKTNANRTRIYVVGYSQEKNGRCDWMPRYISSSVDIFCFDANELKIANGMRDAIHPNYKGNKILAEFISGKIRM